MIVGFRLLLKRLVPFLPAMLLVAACHNAPSPENFQTAVKGVLDLSAWDFDRHGVVSLDGEWEFHWKKLFTPKDFSAGNIAPSCFVTIPGNWSGCSVGGREISCSGFGTYRLIVRMGGKRGLYALKVQDISHAFRLWINGIAVASGGRVAESEDAMEYSNNPRVVFFQSDDDSVEIIIQASNFVDVVCGLVRNIKLGKGNQIGRERDSSVGFNLFLFGSLLIMGLYHLSFYIMRKKDPSAFYFGVFCLIIAVRSLLTEERFLYALIPQFPWSIGLRIDFLTLMAALPFMYFIHTLYRDEFKKIALTVFTCLSIAYAVSVIALPVFISIRVLPYYQGVITVAGFYTIAVLVRAIVRNREGAVIIMAGFIILFSAVVNDILHSHLVIQTAYIVPFGIFIFIFLQSFVLSRYFSMSFARVEEMSGKLEKYANHLEEMVEERTRELENEKEKLRARHEIMEKNLQMARTIQQQLMPDSSPTGYIHSLYRPMDMIGGDYYDFIRFRDSNRIGLFISDVSGHGVPAALIASMMKSLILRAGDYRNDPALLLGYLNSSLLGQTGGNFITAFYGIYDPDNRTIEYANAGHNQPYVVSDSVVGRLSGYKSIPLAILDSESLAERNRDFRNCAAVLERNSRLILYTDGLVEAVSADGSNRLFEDSATVILKELHALPHREFIDRLYGSLVVFRGSENFDDDVCIVCLNVTH